jgi:apolipoprotein N-acyltransferase
LNRRSVQYLLSIVAGAVLPLAFAPYEQLWLAPLSYAVLLYLWSDATPKRALGLSFAYGCASFGIGTYWTYIAVRIIGQAPVFVGVALTVGLTVVLAGFVALAGWLAVRAFRTRGAVAWLLTLPALFVLTEWLRGWLFTGFGWLAAGYSQTDSWLMGYAPLAGVHAMSWGVLVTAGGLLTLWRGTNRERAAAAVVVAAVWLGGLALSGQEFTAARERPLEVALAQGAIAQTNKYEPEQLLPTLQLYAELTRQSDGADLIVWPEAAIPTLIEYVGDYIDGVQRLAKQQGSTLLLGALRLPPGEESVESFQNVVLALTDERQIYIKRHLVPFGEYFPVPDFVRTWMRMMTLPTGDAIPGADDQPPLDVAGERIAIMICYEDVFGAEQLHYLPEATLIVNVSNDAWFGDSFAAHQHLQIARVRAAEVGRYMLRATNTGVTAVIDNQGGLVETLPQFHAGLLEQTVYGYTGSTPYARLGNYVVVMLALVALIAVLIAERAAASVGTRAKRAGAR